MDETYFYIERKIGATGTYSYLTNVGANVTTYTNTGLSQNTEYYYRVRAYNASGYSTYSNEVSATTPALPPPSDLTATPLSSSQIKLTWTDNSSDETYFYIERKTGAAGTYSQVAFAGPNVTTYTNTNLTQDTTYYYRVRAYSSNGYVYSAYSNETSASTSALNAPTNLSVSAISYTQVTLTWTDNSGDESYFYVERKTGSGGTYTQIANIGANVTTFTNTGLTQGTEYYYRVRAYGSPNYSQYSNEVSATTQTLPPPSDLTATPLSSSQIKLTWADNSTDETYFLIEYRTTGNFITLTTPSANTTTYTHTNLTQNTTYTYRVRAYHAGSGSYSTNSNEASATTQTLNAPSNLSVASVSYTQVTLAWTDNSGEETGFAIERKTGAGGTYATIYTTGANATSYTSTGLTQGTEYYYRVRAVSWPNYSQYSNEITATTLTVNAPSGLAATATGATKVDLTWTDNSTDEAGFAIERKSVAGGTYAQIGTVSSNVTTYTSTGLVPNTQYSYRVRAYNGSNYSAYSNEAGVTTQILNAPSNLSVSAASYTQVTLTWTDNSTDETSFAIERKTGAGGTYTQVGSVGANVTSYTNGGLLQGTEYYYRVRAYSGSYYSQYSNEVIATPLVFAAPSGLTATALSSTKISLSWTDNTADELSFYVEYKTNATGTYVTLSSVAANTTSFTHANLTQNTTYYYRVRAYGSVGYSAYSNEASATTTSLNAPSGLTATPLASTRIDLAWTDSSVDESGFAIERKTGPTGTYYQIGSVGSDVATYSNTGLTRGTQYYYRVRAFSGANYSAYSNEADAVTPVVDAPSDLTAAPLSSSQVKLTWKDNAADETDFYLEYRTGETGDFTLLSSVAANKTSYIHSNLSAVTKYYYRIRAYNGVNYSSYSNEANATTPTCVQEGVYQP